MIKSELAKLKFIIFGFLVLLLALSPVTPVFAQELGLGHGFYGTVKIGDGGAEIGSVINARVDGTECGSCQVATAGQYALIVQGSIDDGATIDFYINDQKGNQTFLFHDGWTTELGLTIPEIAPSVDTSAAASVTTSRATLNGNLANFGTALSVDVSFEWGTTTAYGRETTVQPMTSTGSFSFSLTGLSDGTTYHFRAKAVGDGTGYGLDRTFTTRAVAPEAAGVGAAPPAPPAGTTDVRGKVTATGRFTRSVTATSEDELCTLTIPRDTVGLTEELEPLDEITMVIMDEPPPPPEKAEIVGLAYDFGPDGATFDPQITLTWRYDPDALPDGVAEEDLVLAYYDEEAGKWVELDCVVDTENDTITAPVSHFTTFAIIAAITPPPLAPAAFLVFNLTVQPVEVQPKETVTITVTVTNTGGTEGSYSVILKIKEVKEAEQRVTIAAGSSKIVTFSVTREEIDNYSVAVDGLSASFTVLAPVAPPEVIPEVPLLPAKPPFNWTLLGGMIGAVVALGLLAFLLIRRRAYQLTRR